MTTAIKVRKKPVVVEQMDWLDAKIANLQALLDQTECLLNRVDRLICESRCVLQPRVPYVEPYAKGGDSVEEKQNA